MELVTLFVLFRSEFILSTNLVVFDLGLEQALILPVCTLNLFVVGSLPLFTLVYLSFHMPAVSFVFKLLLMKHHLGMSLLLDEL